VAELTSARQRCYTTLPDATAACPVQAILVEQLDESEAGGTA
jgi:hypothetical protein